MPAGEPPEPGVSPGKAPCRGVGSGQAGRARRTRPDRKCSLAGQLHRAQGPPRSWGSSPPDRARTPAGAGGSGGGGPAGHGVLMRLDPRERSVLGPRSPAPERGHTGPCVWPCVEASRVVLVPDRGGSSKGDRRPPGTCQQGRDVIPFFLKEHLLGRVAEGGSSGCRCGGVRLGSKHRGCPGPLCTRGWSVPVCLSRGAWRMCALFKPSGECLSAWRL